jgi:hypothetical protein
LLYGYDAPVEKAKIFTSSPFSFYIKVLAFQGGLKVLMRMQHPRLIRSYELVFAKPLFLSSLSKSQLDTTEAACKPQLQPEKEYLSYQFTTPF